MAGLPKRGSNLLEKRVAADFKNVVESVRDGTVRIRYVSTDWDYADIMTKALDDTNFKKLREMCVSPRNEKGTMLRLIDKMVMLFSD